MTSNVKFFVFEGVLLDLKRVNEVGCPGAIKTIEKTISLHPLIVFYSVTYSASIVRISE